MTEVETKTCQSCQANFVIALEDFAFYAKIDVPPPTWCPDCRLQRRMVWRNERAFYSRTCDLCLKGIISTYPSDSKLVIYCQECWWSDKWNVEPTAAEYDFTTPFFDQFNQLMSRVPHLGTYNTSADNSDYCNYAAANKDCYLLTGGRDNENILYSNRVYSSKDSIDLYVASKLELCYDTIQCENSYRLFSSQYCDNCSDSYFLYDCRSCQNCFGCSNLRNKQYYIFNEPYSKEVYFAKLKELDLGSFKILETMRAESNDQSAKAVRKCAQILKSENSTGDNIQNAKNCQNCFDIAGSDSEDSKYVHHVGVGVKDSYDVYGLSRGELLYEDLALGFESLENSRIFFSLFIKGSSDIQYSYNCSASTSLFGCVGLRNKRYCILNKQYTKEEYEALVPKIIAQMNSLPYTDRVGRVYRYGEVFPPELSPFAYNETIAQEYFPLTQDQASALGFAWKEADRKQHSVTIQAGELPDHIQDAPDSILQEIIGCVHAGDCAHQCTTAFKIVQPELDFYRTMQLALPRLCPNCRHYGRLSKRNPLKLWRRQCACSQEGHDHQGLCPVNFETSYSPTTTATVYCESCYQKALV